MNSGSLRCADYGFNRIDAMFFSALVGCFDKTMTHSSMASERIKTMVMKDGGGNGVMVITMVTPRTITMVVMAMNLVL